MYRTEKSRFFRCLFQNDVQGLVQAMEDSERSVDWLLDGMVKACAQQHWACLKVLVDAPTVALHSEWDIRNCLESVLFGCVEKGWVDGVKGVLPLVDTYNMQTVAKEALRRAVDYNCPNSVAVVDALVSYADTTQRCVLLDRAVRQFSVGLVEYFLPLLPLELFNGTDCYDNQIDLFDYIKTAAFPRLYFYESMDDIRKKAEQQHDVLEILLRGVHPEILAHRLLLEPKDEECDYTDSFENSFLYDWIDRQRLKTNLEQVVNSPSVRAAGKRKV